jgi:hypothetical protein
MSNPNISGFVIDNDLTFSFDTGGAVPPPVPPADIHGQAVLCSFRGTLAGESHIDITNLDGWLFSQDNNDDTKTTTIQSLYVDNDTYIIAAVMYRGDSVTIAEEGWTKIVDSEVADPSSSKQKIAVWGRQATKGTYTVTITQPTSVRMSLKVIGLAGASGVSVVNNIIPSTFPFSAPATTGKRRLYLGSSVYATSGNRTTLTTTDNTLANAEELRFTAFYDSRKASGNISEFDLNITDYAVNFITLDIEEV